jgi:hypothetical protein
MTLHSILTASLATVGLILLVYWACGFQLIVRCYQLWFQPSYWTSYNLVEAVAWTTKAVIIIPGLVFGLQIWQLYYLTLFTSVSLIWASRHKNLPSLVAFNTLWVWISLMVLVEHWL